MFGEHGQAFEPFKMLIGAVMALLVLVVILGAISYFQGLDTDISTKRFFDGLNNAVAQPNGDVLVIEGLQFNKDTSFSAQGLSRRMGIRAECLEFEDNGLEAYEISPDLVKINEASLVDVFVQCSPTSQCIDNCDVCCKISFDKELEAG